jgi:hypothetical protein
MDHPPSAEIGRRAAPRVCLDTYAGLVHVHPDAQRRVYALRPDRLAELDAWLAPYRRRWDGRLDALEAHLDAHPDPNPDPDPDPDGSIR